MSPNPSLNPLRRVPEGTVARPELWLGAAALVGVLLVEVWQSSQVAELCLNLEQSRVALEHANARMEFVRADLQRLTTRAELTPLANQLGLVPADAQQVVTLPSEYLSGGESGPAEVRSLPALAWAERVLRALVPEATARARAAS